MLNQYLRDSEREITKIEKLIQRHKTLKSNFARELEQARYFVNKDLSSLSSLKKQANYNYMSVH